MFYFQIKRRREKRNGQKAFDERYDLCNFTLSQTNYFRQIEHYSRFRNRLYSVVKLPLVQWLFAADPPENCDLNVKKLPKT